MKINSNKIKYFSFCITVVCVFSLSSYLFLFGDKAVSENAFNISASAEKPNFSDFSENTESSVKGNESSAEVNTPSVVSTAASGTVKGQIFEKYISPYSSNLSYKNLYVKNNTDLTPDLKGLLESKLKFTVEENSKPQVLILHTHATESYMLNGNNFYTDSDLPRNTDNAFNMVALGEIVSKRLNLSGIATLHDTTQHDFPSYNESYQRAAKTINSYKKNYKSIKIIIDIHRDSICDSNLNKTKLTKEIGGKKAAQVMIVMGSQSGSVKNFPNYEENLKLAFKLQEKIESTYKGLARGLYLMPRNYNESLSTGSMLIEIGTDANTLEEAKYSAELLSDCLVSLLKEL